MHQNFIVSNFAADGGCLDNDDGSSYYNIHHNVCVFGGHKGDFDGNKKISHDNLHIYPNVYGTTCLNVGAQKLPPKGYGDGYYNNTCILPNAKSPYLRIGGINGAESAKCLDPSAVHAKQALMDGLALGNNTVYVPEGVATIQCGANHVKSNVFAKLGVDPGTTYHAVRPSNITIVGWIREMLVMPQHTA